MYQGANPHCCGCAIEHSEYDFALAIGATTHVDLHGERFAPEAIDVFVESISKQYYPFLLDHQADKPVGALVSAKKFGFSDGEFGVALLIVFYTSKHAAVSFPAGRTNEQFGELQQLIDIDKLLKAHDHKIARLEGSAPSLSPEEALEAYLSSHIVEEDGRVRVLKHFIAQYGDLKIEVYPADHKPAHFHVVSKQRGINVRFDLASLEVISSKQGKLRSKEAELIRQFLKSNPTVLSNLRRRARELEVGKV
jgi:hypothetical protein